MALLLCLPTKRARLGHVPAPPAPSLHFLLASLDPPPSLSRDVLHHCLEHPNLSVTEALQADPEAYRDESERRAWDGILS